MVKVNYPGIRDAETVFRELGVYHARLLALQRSVQPVGAGYNRLSDAAQALARAASHFTGRPFFYGGGPCGQNSDTGFQAHPPRQQKDARPGDGKDPRVLTVTSPTVAFDEPLVNRSDVDSLLSRGHLCGLD